MFDPNDIVLKHGQYLTARVWDLLDYLEDELGHPLYVVQGGFKSGNGAGASAGTHDQGDVLDISVRDIPKGLRVPAVVALRKWNGCAWYRAPEYGWTETGAHIHCVMRDSFYGLSAGARQQVTAYDNGRNGLANNGPDPFPQPEQHHWFMRKEEDVALTQAEIDKIATAVWAKQVASSWDGQKRTASFLLSQSNFYSISGGLIGNIPDTSPSASAGGRTTSGKLLDASTGDQQTLVLTDKDKDDIAKRVVDLLKERL